MSPNEISEYVTEGMKWLAIGGISYIAAMTGLSWTHGLSEKIRSQEELEKVVDEEATKLGLDSSKIDAKYNEERSKAKKNGERYDLHLEGNWSSSTRATVRHELYHILKEDFGERTTLLKYLFMNEPSALIYGSFKVKL